MLGEGLQAEQSWRREACPRFKGRVERSNSIPHDSDLDLAAPAMLPSSSLLAAHTCLVQGSSSWEGDKGFSASVFLYWHCTEDLGMQVASSSTLCTEVPAICLDFLSGMARGPGGSSLLKPGHADVPCTPREEESP